MYVVDSNPQARYIVLPVSSSLLVTQYNVALKIHAIRMNSFSWFPRNECFRISREYWRIVSCVLIESGWWMQMTSRTSSQQLATYKRLNHFICIHTQTSLISESGGFWADSPSFSFSTLVSLSMKRRPWLYFIHTVRFTPEFQSVRADWTFSLTLISFHNVTFISTNEKSLFQAKVNNIL